MVIAVTESNNVYALHADTGIPIWSRTDIGTPAPQGSPCPGNITPVGITGTPVVDLASRSLFFDALVSGNPNKHFIYSLNVDTGVTNADWPVNVDSRGTGICIRNTGRTRRTGSCERGRVRVLLRMGWGLWPVSRLGCGSEYQQPFRDGLGDGCRRRRDLGTWRCRQRWH